MRENKGFSFTVYSVFFLGVAPAERKLGLLQLQFRNLGGGGGGGGLKRKGKKREDERGVVKTQHVS